MRISKDFFSPIVKWPQIAILLDFSSTRRYGSQTAGHVARLLHNIQHQLGSNSILTPTTTFFSSLSLLATLTPALSFTPYFSKINMSLICTYYARSMCIAGYSPTKSTNASPSQTPHIRNDRPLPHIFFPYYPEVTTSDTMSAPATLVKGGLHIILFHHDMVETIRENVPHCLPVAFIGRLTLPTETLYHAPALQTLLQLKGVSQRTFLSTS